jgi:hypothetical protein
MPHTSHRLKLTTAAIQNLQAATNLLRLPVVVSFMAVVTGFLASSNLHVLWWVLRFMAVV